MNSETAKKLIKLNYVFYQTIGEYFDSSRNYYWPGWVKLISAVENHFGYKARLRIFDLGCGNGRFAEFLFKHLSKYLWDYTGIEYSNLLIKKAEQRLKQFKTLESRLILSELFYEAWYEKLNYNKYDIISLFGVMHHIPSNKLRRDLLKQCTSLLSPAGLLVLTIWKFKDVERLQRRIVSDNNQIAEILEIYGLTKDDLEEDDYLLDWQRGYQGYRYCHYYTETEIISLLENAGLKITHRYRHDGKENNVNEYFICTLK